MTSVIRAIRLSLYFATIASLSIAVFALQAFALSKRDSTPHPLLFSFVSDKVGFETVISITNTSADSLGTAAQAGTCKLTYRDSSGGSVPPPFTTTSIPAGGAITFVLSSGDVALGVPAAPNFQGHILAECTFPQARGVSRLTNGAATLVAAEPAEVLGSPADTAQHPLLIPYVNNTGGFDAGVAITNASGALNVPAKDGKCTLNFFGVNAPVGPVQTITIPAGQGVVFTMSGGGSGFVGAPGFQGYIVANCDFPLARGYVFLSDVNALKAASYERAEVLSTPRDTTVNNLLFNLVVTNGLDTNIVIVNTGLDSLGTVGKSGKCIFDYFHSGSANPPSETTSTIAPGESLAISLGNGGSGITAHPKFFGYILARCDFPHARGLAVLSDGPLATTLSELPSEVISPSRSALNFPVLLPYASTMGVRDTVVTISNTSVDSNNPSLAKSGSCSLEYHGNGAALATQSTGTIDPGTTFAFNMRNGHTSGANSLPATPNFEGYLIARCDFPQARIHSLSDPDHSSTNYGIPGEVIQLDDTDSDGVLDINEQCALDPQKTEPGACGCGISDNDSDADGVLDCHESCPLDPAKLTPGVCGCGQIDIDSNSNGAIDCLYGKDVQATYQQLNNSLKKLGFLKLTGNKKKDSAKRLKLSQLRLSLKTLFDSINATLAAHTTDIQNSLPNIKFASLSLAANKSVKTALKMKRLTFSNDKKLALKNIAKLVKSLG